MTPNAPAPNMRRIGVVGDGLSGLIAGLSAATNGTEVAIFARSEPLGGLASPVNPNATWLFDRTPLFWRKKGALDRLLNRLKVPMPSRKVPISKMAIVRENKRYSLPKIGFSLRNSTGDLATQWISLIKSAKKGEIEQLDGLTKDAATLLSLLWDLNPTPNPEAILSFGWKNHPRVAIDGWIGASGRLISACKLTDVSFHTEGPVTGFRRRKNGEIDGVKRKGRVLPVDAVIQASTRSDSVLYGRYLGLAGEYLRPHVVVWDADNEVLIVDFASIAPERVPVEYRGQSSLFHCIAFGDPISSAERVESVLDTQCSGWRSSIVEDFTLDNIRLPIVPESEFEQGIYHAHLGNAFEIGKRASQS